MKITLRKKKKSMPREVVVTAMLIVVVVIVGFFVFRSWQNKPEVVQTAHNVNAQPPSNANQEFPDPQRTPLEEAEPDHLWIPSREIDTPVVYITDEQNTEEGHQEALSKGVVHYPGTSLPGEKGNPYIFGHSSDYVWKRGNYKQVFKPLIDIPIETEVRITNHEGELFIYRVTETKIVGPKEVSVMDQGNYERYLLTLQTSWPLGTALKRYVVVCELDEQATFGQ